MSRPATLSPAELRAKHLARHRRNYKKVHPDIGYKTRLEALNVHGVVYFCNICKHWHTSDKPVAGRE